MTVKDKNGNKRTHLRDVLKIWKDHFEKHLNTSYPHDESVLDSIQGFENNEQVNVTKEQIWY